MTPRLAAYAIALVAIAAVAGALCKKSYDYGYWSGYYEIKRALDTANATHEDAMATMNAKLNQSDKLRLDALASHEKLEGERDAALEDARSKLPLSEACSACRVPAARIHSLRP